MPRRCCRSAASPRRRRRAASVPLLAIVPSRLKPAPGADLQQAAIGHRRVRAVERRGVATSIAPVPAVLSVPPSRSAPARLTSPPSALIDRPPCRRSCRRRSAGCRRVASIRPALVTAGPLVANDQRLLPDAVDGAARQVDQRPAGCREGAAADLAGAADDMPALTSVSPLPPSFEDAVRPRCRTAAARRRRSARRWATRPGWSVRLVVSVASPNSVPEDAIVPSRSSAPASATVTVAAAAMVSGWRRCRRGSRCWRGSRRRRWSPGCRPGYRRCADRRCRCR